MGQHSRAAQPPHRHRRQHRPWTSVRPGPNFQVPWAPGSSTVSPRTVSNEETFPLAVSRGNGAVVQSVSASAQIGRRPHPTGIQSADQILGLSAGSAACRGVGASQFTNEDAGPATPPPPVEFLRAVSLPQRADGTDPWATPSATILSLDLSRRNRSR